MRSRQRLYASDSFDVTVSFRIKFCYYALQFVFTSLGYLYFIVKRHFPTERYLAKFNNCPFMGNIAMFDFLLIAGILMISFIVSFYIPEIWNSTFSKISLMILLIDSATHNINVIFKLKELTDLNVIS